jgi:hypothetical protein
MRRILPERHGEQIGSSGPLSTAPNCTQPLSTAANWIVYAPVIDKAAGQRLADRSLTQLP